MREVRRKFPPEPSWGGSGRTPALVSAHRLPNRATLPQDVVLLLGPTSAATRTILMACLSLGDEAAVSTQEGEVVFEVVEGAAVSGGAT